MWDPGLLLHSAPHTPLCFGDRGGRSVCLVDNRTILHRQRGPLRAGLRQGSPKYHKTNFEVLFDYVRVSHDTQQRTKPSKATEPTKVRVERNTRYGRPIVGYMLRLARSWRYPRTSSKVFHKLKLRTGRNLRPGHMGADTGAEAERNRQTKLGPTARARRGATATVWNSGAWRKGGKTDHDKRLPMHCRSDRKRAASRQMHAMIDVWNRHEVEVIEQLGGPVRARNNSWAWLKADSTDWKAAPRQDEMSRQAGPCEIAEGAENCRQPLFLACWYDLRYLGSGVFA